MTVSNIVITFGDNDFHAVFDDVLSILKSITIADTFQYDTEEQVVSKVKSIIKLVCTLEYRDLNYVMSDMLRIGVNVSTKDQCSYCSSVYVLMDYKNEYAVCIKS